MIYRYNEDPDLSAVKVGDDVEVRLEELYAEQVNELSEKLQEIIKALPKGAAMLTFVDSWGAGDRRTLCTFKFRMRDQNAVSFNCPGGRVPSAVTVLSSLQ